MESYLMFGLNEAGDLVSSERLPRSDQPRLQQLARAALEKWHAVEVWDGQVCILRLRNSPIAS